MLFRGCLWVEIERKRKNVMSDLPHTQKELVDDLRALGVEAGDMLFIHSSLKSLGPVEGGAGTVIAALEDAVGPEGLILMPSFNLLESKELRVEAWNIGTTPSTVGWLTEYFRRMPGTYRSDHYSHSVAARGKGAREFVSGHLHREGLVSPWDQEPWGRTFGTHSPMFKAYQEGGRLLMLGVDYRSSTYRHLMETICWNRKLERDRQAVFRALRWDLLGEFWDRKGNLRRGFVGDAACRLFSIREYVDTIVDEGCDDLDHPLWQKN